jgi:DDE domain
VDETYIKINKHWAYLYRAVDSTGAPLDFMLSPTRAADAAERFFRQVLQAPPARTPRVITVDRNAAYPPAFEALEQERIRPETCLLRQCKYLNNIIEQDHRLVKRRVNPGLGVGAFSPAERTIQGYEALPMLRKGQLEGLAKGDVRTQNRVMNQMFGLAASRVLAQPLLTLHSVFATLPSSGQAAKRTTIQCKSQVRLTPTARQIPRSERRSRRRCSPMVRRSSAMRRSWAMAPNWRSHA